MAHFLEDVLQGGQAWLGEQPRLQERYPLARSGCGKGASSQCIEGGEVWGFIFWLGHGNGSISEYPYIVAEALKFSPSPLFEHFPLKQFLARLNLGLRMFATDVVQGFFAITHNGLAVLGLSIFFFVVALAVRPDLRAVTETKLINWLQERQYDSTGVESDTEAVDRATAVDPRDLPRQQANLAYWLSRKYRVAPEPLSALVSEAYDLGPRNQIEPSLILAVMAVESGFNPFAQSNVGAQGLMQVMTKVHEEKYVGFGGSLAAFDPVANLRVGVSVLKDCINRAGSTEAGLKLYVSAGNLKDDSGYACEFLPAYIQTGEFAIGDSNDSMFIKRYIPDFKNQVGGVQMEFLVRQYPGSVQLVASSTVVYSTTTKIDMRARGRTVAIKMSTVDSGSSTATTFRFGTLRIDAQVDGAR